MVWKRQEICNKTDYYLQKFHEQAKKIERPCGIVYMGHCVTDVVSDWYNEEYSASATTLVKWIDSMLEDKVRFCSLSDLKKETDKNRYFLTFDDGFAGLYTELQGKLDERGIPYCIFISPSLLGKEGYLTEDMLIKMCRDPLCTIGAHSMTHKKLRSCKKKECEWEISECKRWLEEKSGREINYFAYPFGNINSAWHREIKIAKKCSYRMAFSTIQTHFTVMDLRHPFYIPRMNINEKVLQNYLDDTNRQ